MSSKNNKCSILMYHNVKPRLAGGARYPNSAFTVFCDDFEEQAAFLAKNYRVLSKEEFVVCVRNGSVFPERCVLITFDDGNADLYRCAYPVLKEHGIPAVVFLPTAFVGTDRLFWWDELEHHILSSEVDRAEVGGIVYEKGCPYVFCGRISSVLTKLAPEKRTRLLKEIKNALRSRDPGVKRSALTWDEVREMSRHGISFQPHTRNHVRLSDLTETEACAEITGSIRDIKENLGAKTDVFAYPYGLMSDFGRAHMDILKKEGVSAAFSAYDGKAARGCHAYALPRIEV